MQFIMLSVDAAPCRAGGGCPLRGATRAAVLAIFFLFLAVVVNRSQAQSPTVTVDPVLGDCPVASYVGDISLLNSVWVQRCSHCLAAATSTPTPTFGIIPPTITPTRTSTLTPTTTPTRTPTATGTQVLNPAYVPLNEGYYSYLVEDLAVFLGYNSGIPVNLPDTGTSLDLSIVAALVTGLRVTDNYPGGYDDGLFFAATNSPVSETQGLRSLWYQNADLLGGVPACLDAEMWGGSWDDMCDGYVDGGSFDVAYHDHVQYMPYKESFVISFWLDWDGGDIEFKQPYILGQNWFATDVVLILADNSMDFPDLPTLVASPSVTPTLGTPEPVCEVIEPYDVDVFGEVYWGNMGNPGNSNGPNNAPHGADFGLPTNGPPYPIPSGVWGNFWLHTTNQNYWVDGVITSQASVFAGDSNNRRVSGGGIIALGGSADLEGIGWSIDFGTIPSNNGGQWAGAYALVWTWDTVAARWEAYDTTLITPPALGGDYDNVMFVFPEDVSYLFFMLQIDSYAGVLPTFTMHPKVKFGGEWLELGDELCIDPPLTTPTPTLTMTPTYDGLGPTWTPTFTRTPIATFTRTFTMSPTPAVGFCSVYQYRQSPTPSPTPLPSGTPDVTQTQSALDGTATHVNTGTATAIAGTVWAVATGTAAASSATPTSPPVQSTATSLALTSTVTYPTTATYVAGGDDEIQAQATFNAYSTQIAVEYTQGGGGGNGSTGDYVVDPETGLANKNFSFPGFTAQFNGRSCYSIWPKMSWPGIPVKVPGLSICVRWYTKPSLVLFRVEIPIGELMALLVAMAIWKVIRW